MATIKFEDLRKTMKQQQADLDKQIEDGQKKLAKAIEDGDNQEKDRITKELECRAKAKTALDSMVMMSTLACCDQFFNCPDI